MAARRRGSAGPVQKEGAACHLRIPPGPALNVVVFSREAASQCWTSRALLDEGSAAPNFSAGCLQLGRPSPDASARQPAAPRGDLPLAELAVGCWGVEPLLEWDWRVRGDDPPLRIPGNAEAED